MVIASRIILTVALLSALPALPDSAPAAAKSRATANGFSVGEMRLGMGLAEFERATPVVRITRHEGGRFCYGRRIVLDELGWASAVGTTGDVSIRATFRKIDGRLRLTSLLRIEAFDFQVRDLTYLQNRLQRRYGPFSRLLVRRKMEPAGRIIGFEWLRPTEARLSVVVREDHGANSGQILLETLLTGSLPGMRMARALALQNQTAIEAFHRQCRMATNRSGDRGKPSH
jgi:hypothetical protein